MFENGLRFFYSGLKTILNYVHFAYSGPIKYPAFQGGVVWRGNMI